MQFKRWPRDVFAVGLLAVSAITWAQVPATSEAVAHDGLRIFYNRDRGLITGIDIQLPRRARTPFVTDIKWFPSGSPRSWKWASGAAANRAFDLDGRMTSSEFASYRYDAAGRMTGITQYLWAAGPGKSAYTVPVTWEVTYDSRDRITGFSRDGASSQYTYDANSNRLSGVETVSSGLDLDLDAAFDGTDLSQRTEQSVQMDVASNRMLGFTRTVTRVEAGQTRSVVTTPVNYTIDPNGNITSDGLRVFEYADGHTLTKVRVSRAQNAASIHYLVNALGQRVFKSEPVPDSAMPDGEAELERGFVDWLRQRLGWLFNPSPTQDALGTVYAYGDGPLPVWALLGEYDTGTARGKGMTEYIWMPLPDGSAIPVGMVRNGNVFAIHTDHLGTPRLVTDDRVWPVWQWPYSAFGANPPVGLLEVVNKPKKGSAGEGASYRATHPREELNLRFPGQYWDEESQLVYNFNRSYRPDSGRYGQADPIGLGGGLNRYLYAGANALAFIDPDGLMEVLRTHGVSFHANPGEPSGGNEHARNGPGAAYHLHLKDKEGREARISSETWKPLTPEDERVFKSSPQMQKACDSLTDGEKKFLDRVNRQVFHRGTPTDKQLLRLIQMRTGGRGGRGIE